MYHSPAPLRIESEASFARSEPVGSVAVGVLTGTATCSSQDTFHEKMAGRSTLQEIGSGVVSHVRCSVQFNGVRRIQV